MYFLTSDEKQELVKGLIPKTREVGVAEELRGWEWHQPPLQPFYSVKLPVYQVSSRYCPTGRDTYLARVHDYKADPNESMIFGSLMHEILNKVLVNAKKLVYMMGVDNLTLIEKELTQPIDDWLKQYFYTNHIDLELYDILSTRANQVHSFEVNRIINRLQDVLSRFRYVREDSLVAQSIPIALGYRLDGTRLGLSSNLSTDAMTIAEPMVINLKFGEPRDFHRLTTTAYALVMESLYEHPVDLGCVIYVQFEEDRILINKDMHMIDDELRQWFIEERDEKMRMVYEEIDPGISSKCPSDCSYYNYCY